jgi:DNA-binding CsgD family transcriptional regulator
MRTRASVLVGREAEFATALSRVRQAARGGGDPACFCVGAPGAGKSRLLAEVASRAAADGLIVVHGRAGTAGSASPLRPFAEALAALQRRGLLPDDHLGGYRPLLARVLPELSGPGRLSTGDAAPIVAFAEAVLRVLTVIGGADGCLLVLEDLHDADPESLAVLEYLLDNTAGTPVALLGTLRDEAGNARRMLARGEQRSTAQLLPIRPLDRSHSGLLVAACLGADQPPAQLVELAWRNAAGNPLMVEELLYDLIDSGQLSRQGEDWRLSADPVLAPPPSLLQLVESRMDRAGEVARRVLITAAVYGEHFPLAAVQTAVGVSALEFMAGIELVVANQLIVAEVSGGHRFHHPLIHGAVLELAGAAERRRAADRLAEAVLAADPELAGATCRLAARLLSEADRPAAASDLYARAGRQALHADAVEWAVADLTEAVRLRGPGGLLPAELVGDLVRASWQACQLDRALVLVERLDPAVDGPTRRARAFMHLDLIRGCHNAGRKAEAELQLARARALIAGIDSELLRIYCDAMAARLTVGPIRLKSADATGEQLARSAADAAERLAGTAIDAAERDKAAEVACLALNALLLILRMQDRHQEHAQHLRRLAVLAGRHNLAGWGSYERFLVIQDQWMADGDDLPLRALREQAQRLGQIWLALSIDTDLHLHRIMVSEGSLVAVIASLNGHIELAQRLGDTTQMQWALGNLVLAAGFRADRPALTEALTRYEWDPPFFDREQDPGTASALCLTLEGRDSEALAVLAEMTRHGLVGPHFLCFPLGLMVLLEAVLDGASPEEVATTWAGADDVRWTRQFLHWAAAVHAGRRGDRAEAERRAALAAADAEIFPLTRHLAARLVASAAAADGWGRPIEDLRAAEAWFHEQGVPAAARNCRDVLRSLGASVQHRRGGVAAVPATLRAAGITAREYEVGLLVREHLGNRDIGRRLHISPRTVEKHIAALLTKLTAPDRRALIERIDTP